VKLGRDIARSTAPGHDPFALLGLVPSARFHADVIAGDFEIELLDFVDAGEVPCV